MQNILTATYATGNIVDFPEMDATLLGSVPTDYLDFTASPDDQADWERMIRENPPSPSVFESLSLFNNYTDYTILAMANIQAFDISVS